VSQASATKAPIAKTADKVAGIFVPAVIFISLITLIVWLQLGQSWSYALARAIETIGDVDLILCGKQAVDGDTAQVGAGIAAKLNIRQAANVWKIERIEEDAVTVRRLNEHGYDIVKLEYPALITVVKDINSPRIPRLHDARIARRAEIPIWKPEDIGADPELMGLKNSPTQVVKTAPPAARDTAALKIDARPDAAAAQLVAELLARKLVQGVKE
ncbi:MAG: hypothetical protein II879_12695, partial [Clostridia bacterium]|nr:hypothetical protein [Clostridia bacterium]